MKQLKNYAHEAEWTAFHTHCFSYNLGLCFHGFLQYHQGHAGMAPQLGNNFFPGSFKFMRLILRDVLAILSCYWSLDIATDHTAGV
jgi:hypothetical protein